MDVSLINIRAPPKFNYAYMEFICSQVVSVCSAQCWMTSFGTRKNVCTGFYHLNTRSSKTGTLANSEDLDEMPHHAAIHLDLHCLLRQNKSSEKETNYFLEIITCDPQYVINGQYCLNSIKLNGKVR